MRTAVTLFLLALVVRSGLIALFPDPAYADSYYYVDVARALAGGHGLNIDFVWIFAEVGNRIPAAPILPIPANAHWLPLASFVQAPFIYVMGPTAWASALPMALIGSLGAPLTWQIAREAGARRLVANSAGILAAIPAAGTVFMAQPDNFAIFQPLIAATLLLVARGLKGDNRAFALAGLLAGAASLARNDGILLLGAIGIVWLGDRIRWWRRRSGSRGWSRADTRPPIAFWAAIGSVALFLVIMGPWWLRQLAVFGSISPTSSTGVALWIRNISEWNSITADPSLAKFLAQGPGPILASRLTGLIGALENFVVIICSVVLVPFLLVGAAVRARSRDFAPWFVYAAVVFSGSTLLYPLHVAGGAFIHSGVGLEPHAYVLSVEGVLVLVGWVARRRATWRLDIAGPVFVGAIVALTVATAAFWALEVQGLWDTARQPRIALARELDVLAVPQSDRLLSIDAAGMKYWTNRPGVVTPNDSIDTIEAVARAYGTRWLVLERDDVVPALAPVLAAQGTRPSWIGAPVFSVPSAAGGAPRLALYPVCVTPADARCGP